MHINGAANLPLLHCFFCFCSEVEHEKSECIFLVLHFAGELCAGRCRSGVCAHFFCANCVYGCYRGEFGR